MTKYNNGKRYKIEPNMEHEEGDIYIGSTTKEYLSQRMSSHHYDYNSFKKDKRDFVNSYFLFDKYGFDNCNIILLELVNVNTKDELLAREQYYIQTLKCVNKNIPLRTQKEWYIENIEKIKQYRENKKEEHTEYCKNYYIVNKDKLKDNAKQYRKDNKDIISEKDKIKFTCECGSILRKTDKARHNKTSKHLKHIENNII
jgi:hypothetical protein